MSDDHQSLMADERPHSTMGPSSFVRSETCPASVMVEGAVDNRSSGFAQEGTTAHALMEAALKTGEETYFWEGTPVTEGGTEIGFIDMEMIEHIDPVVEFIRSEFDDGFQIEPHLVMPKSRMYGYADVLGTVDGLLAVGDLKYGMIHVPADSVQLGLYAIMASLSSGRGMQGAADTDVVARTYIFQPRLPNPIRSHDWTAGDLRSLWSRVVKLDHMLDTAGNSLPYKAGKHCQYCNRAASCPQLRLLVTDAAMAQVASDPDMVMTLEELEEVAHMMPAVKHWITNVTGLLDAYLRAGGVMQQAKLVKGRNTRTWANESGAIELLERYGVDPYHDPKMLSPAQAEKALPKLAKAEAKQYVELTPGKPRLAMAGEPGEPIANMQGLKNAQLSQMAGKLLTPK